VFKGGTSLSKVFGVIERFSEDSSAATTGEEGCSGAGAGRVMQPPLLHTDSPRR
jgi:hypothetical protein